MIKKIFENKIYVFLTILFWGFIIFLNNPFDSSKGTLKQIEHGSGNCGVIEQITMDKIVEQSFVAEENNLSEICLKMATYARTNQGTVDVSIARENGEFIFQSKLNMQDIADNSWVKFNFNEECESKGQKYKISIFSEDAVDGNAITIYYGTSSDENAFINGTEQNGALNFTTSYRMNGLQYLKIICWIIAIACSLLLVVKIQICDEKMFLKIAIIYGMLIIFISPFPHALDESTHFFRSFMISQGDFYDTTNEERIGGYVSDNYGEIVEKRLSILDYVCNPDVFNESFSDNKEFYTNPYMSSVTPFNHSIGAIGILLGNLFALPAIVVIILGRICDLAFYTVLCYLAIKKAEYYKSLYFMVATLPIGLFLAGSYSIDPILISSSLLFISICLKYYFNDNQKITRSELILLLVCGIFIASVKYLVYTPILLLFFLIPRKCFSKKVYLLELGSAILIIAIMVLFQLKGLNMFEFTEDRNGDVDVSRQIQFILHNKMFSLRNFSEYFVSRSLPHIEDFGYSSIAGVPVVTSYIGIFVLVASMLEKNKYNFAEQKKKRLFGLLSLFILFIVFGLTIVALYAGFTPVGKYAVEGLQTRYLVPVIIFLMIPLSFIDVKNNIKNYEKKISFMMNVGMINLIAGLLLVVFG